MKSVLTATVAVLGFAGVALADPAEGVWKTEVDDGAYAHISIAKCGAKLCGTFVRTFNSDGEYKSDVIGKRVFWDMNPEGGGVYSSDKSGRIWRPSNDKTYKSKMTLTGTNSLLVQGCVGPICPKQNWTRVK